MLKIMQQLTEADTPQTTLTLSFERRQKSRLRVRLDNGEEAALMLPRGIVLRHGDLLLADNGWVVAVQAEKEDVSTAFAKDTVALARACYHLGNRHVALQIGENWVRYLHDHVLDAMVQDLGLKVMFEQAPFEPEAGAYSHGHRHEH